MTARRIHHRAAAAVGAALAVLMVAGCAAAVAPGTAAGPPTTRTTVSPSLTPTPTATPAPSLRPEGSAAENLPYFAHVIAGYVATVGRGERAQLIAHLVNAGFAPEAIESGWATTPNGLQESSIEAAVRVGDDCLIATVRADRSATTVMPILSTGRCLIGDGFGTSG